MKLCKTCGKAHPDDVSTSHHPNGCTCISHSLHANDGNNQGPGGCIWMRTVMLGQNPELEYLRTILEYERWRSGEPSKTQ